MLYSIRYICGVFFSRAIWVTSTVGSFAYASFAYGGDGAAGQGRPDAEEKSAEGEECQHRRKHAWSHHGPPSLPPLLESRMQILCKLTEIICWLQSALCYFFQISSPPSHPRTSDPTNSDSMTGIIRISYANCMQISCGGAYELNLLRCWIKPLAICFN